MLEDLVAMVVWREVCPQQVNTVIKTYTGRLLVSQWICSKTFCVIHSSFFGLLSFDAPSVDDVLVLFED